MLRKIFVFINRNFWRIFYCRSFSTYKEFPCINARCHFSGTINIGANVHFNGARLYASGGLEIGDNFHSGKGLIVLTQNHNYSGEALPYDCTVIKKRVVIGDNVWCGLNVVILPGVTIGEGAIIQVGAVVSRSVPQLAIVGGNPAKVIKYRDEGHYYRLKRQGSFY